MHPKWGPLLSLQRSWAANDAVRCKAAAGGTLTALGVYLLDSGKVEAVVHVRASASDPITTDSLVSRTAQDVVSGAQSRYATTSPLQHVMRLLDEGTRFAVIGKPCDVAAIRALGRIDPRVSRQIPYLLTIFCGGEANLQTAEKIAAYHGVPSQGHRAVPLARRRLARSHARRGQGRSGLRHELRADLVRKGQALDVRSTISLQDLPGRHRRAGRCGGSRRLGDRERQTHFPRSAGRECGGRPNRCRRSVVAGCCRGGRPHTRALLVRRLRDHAQRPLRAGRSATLPARWRCSCWASPICASAAIALGRRCAWPASPATGQRSGAWCGACWNAPTANPWPNQPSRRPAAASTIASVSMP